MTRFVAPAFLAFAFLSLTAINAARAEDFIGHPPDDRVVIDLSAEDWVTTKTAHVTINVEAAVNAGSAGTTREEMFKAVNDLAKADWRLTSFDRSQDQTGLERWSTSFEARVPENQLSGLGESAKKLSKAGMQLTVGNIDFSPTLEEMEQARATLRAQMYKQAVDQLASVNAAIPGHNYRIAVINFTGSEEAPQPPRPMPHVRMGAMAMVAAPAAAGEPSDERAEKVTLTAHVVFAAAAAPATDQKH